MDKNHDSMEASASRESEKAGETSSARPGFQENPPPFTANPFANGPGQVPPGYGMPCGYAFYGYPPFTGMTPPWPYPPPQGVDPRHFYFHNPQNPNVVYGNPPFVNGNTAPSPKGEEAASAKAFSGESMEEMMKRYGQLQELLQGAAKGEPDVPGFMNFFETVKTDFWKGAVVGTILAVLATSPTARNALAGLLAGLWGAVSPGTPSAAVPTNNA